jgi:inhibitor-of-growth protein 1
MLSEMIETKFRAVDRDFQNNINNKPDRIQSPVPSSSTARNASIVQQVLSALPLKNSSAPGSNISSSTNSENNGSGQDKNAKRARRTRTDTTIDEQRLDIAIKAEPKQSAPSAQSSGSSVKNKASTSSGGSGKKQKKAARKTNVKQNTAAAVPEQVPGVIQDDTIDPDEETYCLCGQISYGEMILCENDLCPIEWFHFSCVSLQSKPKGRWFCPQCRGDRPNVMNKNLRKKYQDSPNTDRKFI